MDNSLQWSSPRPMGFALVGGGLLLLVAAALSRSDPPGLAIMGIAGVLLAALGLGSILIRPRLAAEAGALTIRSFTGRRTYRRKQIQRIRIVSYPRFGRQVPNLEIDIVDESHERLVILGRWELGTHPIEVADDLERLGFPVDDSTTIGLRPDANRDDGTDPDLID